jgi:hypothetical protein
MNAFLADLVRTVSDRWQRGSFSLAAFPALAFADEQGR